MSVLKNMPVYGNAFIFALALGMTAPAFSPAFAQEAAADTATETAAETTPEAAEAAQITDLAMGEDADEENQIGATYIGETVDDWAMQCIRTEEDNDPCQMYQLLKDENDTAVAEISIFRLPAGNQAVAGAMVAVPLETLLTTPMLLSVDGSKGKRYPFSFCNQIGCYARIGFTKEDVASFKRGVKGTITIVPFVAPDQKVVVTMSLKGFTAAFDKASIIEN